MADGTFHAIVSQQQFYILMQQKKCVLHLQMKVMIIFTAVSAIPHVDEFVEKMCALEGAEAGFATATGMAAVFASILHC